MSDQDATSFYRFIVTTSITAFDYISGIVFNKRVSLLGSAPGSYRDSLFPKENPLICINASALGLLGERTPDVTIINTAVAGSPNAGKPTRELLPRLKTNALIIVESGFSIEKSDNIFSVIDRKITKTISLDERCHFLEEFLGKKLTGRGGGEHVPSTGFFSILMLLACGSLSCDNFWSII